MFIARLSYQTTFCDLCAHLCKLQFTQPPTRKQRFVGYISQCEWWFGKVVEFFVRFKTDFGEDQTEKIAEKHVDAELVAFKLEVITILPNLVRVKYGQDFGFERVEVNVSDDGA